MKTIGEVLKEKNLQLDTVIVGAFKSIWPDSWGPRMEYILYNAIAALLDCQNTSLLGVNRMLTDENYRAWVNPRCRQPEPIQRPDAIGSLRHHLFQGQMAASIQGGRHQAC
jgi:hypothetical protein